MLAPFVVVIMRVFSVFITAPSGSAISLNVVRSSSTSSNGTRKLASSTYARIMVMPPRPSSLFFLLRLAAFERSFSSTCFRMWLRTIAARIVVVVRLAAGPQAVQALHKPFNFYVVPT